MFQEFFLRQQVAVQDEFAVLHLHQMAQDFRREVEEREQFAAYCEWYYETAACHQQELLSMRREFNLLGWLTGRTAV